MDLYAYNILLTTLSNVEVHLIRDVFKNKALQFGTLYHCASIENLIYVQKILNKNDIRFSSFRIDRHTPQIEVTDLITSRIGVVIKTSCENWTQVFEPFVSNMFTKSKYSWLIFTDDVSSITETLSTYPIEINSDVTIISKVDNIFKLYEVYNTGFYTNGRFHVQPVGYWASQLWKLEHKREDLSGVKLKSAVVLTHAIANQTFEEFMTESKLEVDSLHKLKYFTLLKYWQEMYNVSLILQRTDSWGYLKNGSFDGMVGTLQRHESDIGGSPVFIRRDRAMVIDYVTATWPSKPCFIFRHPKHPGGFNTIYTRPLCDEVWWCILALVFTAGALLCTLLKQKVIKMEREDADASASLALLSVWSAVCQQGMAVDRKANSVKLVVFTSFLFSLTVYQYYNATVVSTLLRVPPVTIRTLQDLLESKLKAGVEDTLYNRDYFKRTTDPIAIKMFNKKIAATPRDNFYPPEQGMWRVKRGDFAFHADPAYAYPIIKRTFTEREICELQEVYLFPPQNMFAVMKKGSPYRKYLSYGIRKMYESGLMHRLRSIWDEPKPPCVRTPDSSVFTVSLKEFSTPLVLLGVGMVAANMVLLAELFVFKMRSDRIQFRM